jgi:hypothetical protein
MCYRISPMPPDVSQCMSPLRTVARRHRVYKDLVTACTVIPQYISNHFMSFCLFRVPKLICFFSLQYSFCLYELLLTVQSLFPLSFLCCCWFLNHLEHVDPDYGDLPITELKNLYKYKGNWFMSFCL